MLITSTIAVMSLKEYGLTFGVIHLPNIPILILVPRESETTTYFSKQAKMFMEQNFKLSNVHIDLPFSDVPLLISQKLME